MSGMGELMSRRGGILVGSADLKRASGAYQRKLDWLLLTIGGIVVAGSALFILESTPMEFMHSSSFYRAVTTAFPIRLIAISVVSKKRWPATAMAAMYTAQFLACLWIFPFFPAPLWVGPVYHNVTHMM